MDVQDCKMHILVTIDSEEEFAENFVTECYVHSRFALLDRYRLGGNMGRWFIMGLYILTDIYFLTTGSVPV